jgi:hypothetical protein
MIEWISCKDRMPPLIGRLILFQHKDAEYPFSGCFANSVFSHWHITGNKFYYPEDITHWAEINLPKKLLTIHEAIDAFYTGKKIRRISWKSEKYISKSRPSLDNIFLADLLGEDWEIVE